MLNLFLNASDAMSDVEDRPRQLVIRTERDEGDRVRLTVQDAGWVWKRRRWTSFFDAFYTTKSDGMGIGLSVSRSIIESHHGVYGPHPTMVRERRSRFVFHAAPKL